MKIEDVNEGQNQSNMGSGPVRNLDNGISDEEYIKKSLEAMNNQKPISDQQQIKPKSSPVANPSQQQNLSEVLSGNTVDYNDLQNSNYWEITNLPSRYKLYPEGTKIMGRPLKTLELKKLSSMNDSNANFIINDILKKTIKGINIDDIYIADKLFLILWLRANSFRDSSFRVDFHCDKCETDSDFHFDVDNIEIKYLSDSYNPDKQIVLKSGHRIKLDFLTIGDENKVERFKENNKGSLMEFDSEMLTIASMISEVDGQRLGMFEKYMFVVNLDPQDFTMIVSYVDTFGMGIQPYMNVKCAKCGGISQLAVTFRPEFFFPSYKFE